MKLVIDPDWLLRMAEAESGCCISVGGFWWRNRMINLFIWKRGQWIFLNKYVPERAAVIAEALSRKGVDYAITAW